MSTPWFFKLLDISPTDDKRVIRRAYATALKQIDQETQTKEFEKLRQAYELALAWNLEEEDDESLVCTDEEMPFFTGQTNHPPLMDEQKETDQKKPNDSDIDALNGSTQNTTADEQYSGPKLSAIDVSHETRPITTETQKHTNSNESPEVKVRDETPPNYAPQVDDLTIKAVFKVFIEAVKLTPPNAKTLLTDILNHEALIPLEARAKFELLLISWLYESSYNQATLFETAVTLFYWQEHLPTLNQSTDRWLKQTIKEWQLWQKEDERWRKQALRAINKHRFLISLNERRALSSACLRYPQWMTFLVDSQHLNKIKTSAEISTQSNQKTLASYVLCFVLLLSATLIKMELDKPEIKPLQIPIMSAEDAKALKKVLETKKKEKDKPKTPPPPSAMLKKQTIESGATDTSVKKAQTIVQINKINSGRVDIAAYTYHDVATFNMSRELCRVRATLVGRWGDLYGNQATYHSFENEVYRCLDNRWWPIDGVEAKEYLARLKQAWRDANDAGNASLVGLERKMRFRSEDPSADLVMICDAERQVNPVSAPKEAGCVLLAATYTPPKIPSFKVSPDFCQKRSQTTKWHFDSGAEWQNYLGYKQEAQDCIVNGWWPTEVSLKGYLLRLKQAWKQSNG